MISMDTRYETQTNVYKLEGIRVAKPRLAGSRWRGVSHYKMVMALLDYINECEMEWSSPRYFLSRSNADITFAVNIEGGEYRGIQIFDDDDNMQIMLPAIGFTASNARRSGLKFYVGAYSPTSPHKIVMESWAGKSYTIKFSPERQMQSAVDEFIRRWHRVEDVIRKTKNIILSDLRLRSILVEAGQRGLMPWKRIGRTADAMERERASVWRTCLEFGKIVERNPPQRQMNQLYGFATICREYYPEVMGSVEEVEAILMK